MASDQKNYNPVQFNYRDLFRPYLKNRKWFVLSVILFLFIAFLVLRYTTPEYAAEAKIQVFVNQNNSPEVTAFQELGMLSSSNNLVDDEIQILSSRSNLTDVVRKLGLNTKILAKGKIRDSELYENPPFKLKFLGEESSFNDVNVTEQFELEILSSSSFRLTKINKGFPEDYSFGSTIDSAVGDLVIIPNVDSIEKLRGKIYTVVVVPVKNVVNKYKGKLFISAVNEQSNIIMIGLNDPVKQKAVDIIRELIDAYNRNAIEDKKTIANRTAEFINDRISVIYGNLSSVDQSAEEFKEQRGITDVVSQSNINLNVGAASQQELQNANVQLNIASSMKDIIDSQGNYDVLPANIGLNDPTIANITSRYNELVLERNRLLKSSNEKNPIIVNLDEQLQGLKRNLQSSLSSMTNNLNLEVNNLSRQVSQINARIYSAPGNERALRDISRRQQTTEALYLYLLQKREEAQVSYASSASKSKIIDSAYPVSDNPIYPVIPLTYLTFLILGLVVPFAIVYVKDLMDNKVHNKVGLEKTVLNKAPVIAELPKVGKKENKLVNAMDRSVLGESLRILRTNLDYVLKKKATQQNGNMILVTSSIPGEGKTFISSNLAMVFASAGKKVLLVGADIRNPKLRNFYSDLGVGVNGGTIGPRNKSKKGLTEFLYDDNLLFKDTVTPLVINEHKVDIVFSGKIPPNPAELLMSSRLKEFMDFAMESYDYVIVDSAPMLVVTDTLLISDYAHQILYVTKAGVTDQKVLAYPIKLLEEKKVKNLSFVVNGVKENNLGYGRKYGYGYGRTVKKWWKFA